MMARIIALRGSSRKYPENSLRAFQYALKHGANSLEVDVRRALDGIIYCFHDPKLNRLTGHPGYFRRSSSERIGKLRLNATEPILKLEDFLEEFSGKSEIVLDIKSAGIENELLKLVQRHPGKQQVIFSSFNSRDLVRVKELSAKARVALIVSPIRNLKMRLEFGGFLLRRLRKIGCEAAHLSVRLARPKLVERITEAGFSIAVWTVDDVEQATELQEMGVDGIITNIPEKMTMAAKPPATQADTE